MSKNSTRPSRAFFDFAKDRAYIHSLNLEMQETVSGTFCFYWAHDESQTTVDELYNETIGAKVYRAPVKIWAAVEYKEQEEEASGALVERKKSIGLKFFRPHLRDVQLTEPKSGDIIQAGNDYYEVVKVTESDPLLGDLEDMHTFSCSCEQARPYDISALPSVAASSR